ncbi:hypothetical protein, partial [Pseudomonas syringae]|uniref:hypothetical protein n=1 Tax=Pseudomonas syringae TaxID=317 RepID=UPI001FF71049
ETDLPDRAGKTRACLTAGPNQPEHKKTDTPRMRFSKSGVSLRPSAPPGLVEHLHGLTQSLLNNVFQQS